LRIDEVEVIAVLVFGGLVATGFLEAALLSVDACLSISN
jgi:hypothetical protein